MSALFVAAINTGFPLLNVFLSILWFALFVVWIYLLFMIFTDIFRSHDLKGWTKAVWAICILILPLLGAFIYLIARGGKMHEHAIQASHDQQAAFQRYVQHAATSSGAGTADQLQKLADLKAQGALTDAEFASQKSKLLG